MWPYRAAADAILTTEEFGLVILDIGLPGMDGFEVLRRIRPTAELSAGPGAHGA